MVQDFTSYIYTEVPFQFFFFFWGGGEGVGRQILTLLRIVNCEVLIRSATREATRTHQFITNNQASFHLWGKEKLVKHQNMIKHDLLLYLVSFMLSY